MRLIECVPNFSEGRRGEVIGAIRAAAESVPGVVVLDQHSDVAHNRTVLTFVGEPSGVAEAAFRCARCAAQLIDLNQHRGEHPRIGATDVIPFVPLGSVGMEECVALARAVGARLGSELGIPVYLYAEAASRPERRWLPTIRRGEFEGLRQEIGRLPQREPDFGPSVLGAAGATAVGARPPLIAFNIFLASGNVQIAREIAREVRQSSGGLAGVQARGMATESAALVQVSMNLLDFRITPPHVAFARVRELAKAAGVEVVRSEMVGLVPIEALTMAAEAQLLLEGLTPGAVLEQRLLDHLLRAVEEPG